MTRWANLSLRPLSKIGYDHIDAISSDDPTWLQDYRRESLKLYDSLPLETSPLYNKYTDAARMDTDTIGLSYSTDDTIPPRISERLQDLDDATYILQVGTHIPAISISEAARSDGINISKITDAISENPDVIRTALESSQSDEDRFTALNNAAFNTGIFIYIPPGVELDEPIHIITALPEDGASVVSRNVVKATRNSRATIVQELYGGGSGQAYLELLNVSVESGAHLDATSLQMLDDAAYNFSTRRTDMAADSQVNWYLGLFGSQLSRYRIGYHLNGSGAAANDSEVVFGSGSQSFDIHAEVVHNSPATEGRVTEKSILRERSRSLFKGMIHINENAAKSNSYLSGRSILLGREAKSDSIPGLEILTNDVKATHSASVAQVDEEQIFYLMSRCLSRQGAERTIVEGFLEPLSRRMSNQIRAWIAYLIESKWEGQELSINTDEELRRLIEVEKTRYNENTEIEQHYKYRR